MPRRHDDEQLLNGELARLLTIGGVDAAAEQKVGRRKIDVIARVDGVQLMLEAEAGFQKQRQAIQDADARIRQGLTVIAVAVCYPGDAAVAGLANAELLWTLRTRPDADWSPNDWSRGGIAELCAAVKQAPAAFDDIDGAARILSQALDAAAARLTVAQRDRLARAVNLPAIVAKKKGKTVSDGYFTTAKRGLLVVATAMLFHHRLHDHLPALRPTAWSGAWPPQAAAQCANDPLTTVDAFREAWAAILAVDYRPIFETALNALDALPVDTDGGQIVQTLARSVEQVARLVSGMRHDLLGRIFHWVLDTARYDGSYYTSTAAATLLAGLAVRPEDCDWSDADAISRLRICDPACGTGTLLMAAARRIHELHEGAGKGDADDEALLAEALVEDVLWGYDINITATHMAASALGMISPKTQLRNMNVHIAKFGAADGKTYAGSLELLDGQLSLDIMPGAIRQVDDGRSWAAAEHPEPMDLIIMNPPFTRADLRYDQLSDEHTALIRDREKQLVAHKEYRAAIDFSGGSPIFVALGEEMLNNDVGAIALILPSAIPTAPSGDGIRRHLARMLHVETVVSFHDPERIYMSENTTIGEVLVIARRWPRDTPKPPTTFINLARNPATPYEALDVVRRVSTNVGGEFTVQTMNEDRIRDGDWYACNFLSPALVRAYQELCSNALKMPPRKLREIAAIGGQGRSVPTAYARSDLPTTSGRRALWHYRSDVTRTMRADTDSYIEPKPSKRPMAERYWTERSRLLLPERWRLPLGAVGAVWLDYAAIGSRWVACSPFDGDEATELALCGYLNSSVGILARLGGRDNRIPQYPQFSLETIGETPVPDFTSDRNARRIVADCVVRLRDSVLLPLPEMNSDPVRRQLDEAVAEALGLDVEWLAGIRRALSEEPSITNRRFGT